MAKKTYIIAECGCEHLGKVELAEHMIWKAKEAGASCAKFQLFYRDEVGEMWPSIKKFQLTNKELGFLKGQAEKWKIDFLVSAFGNESLRRIYELGCKAVKIPAPCNEYSEMLDNAFGLFDKVYISTGMCEGLPPHASMENAVVLECTSAYPCPYSAVRLHYMNLLCDGLSDHTMGIEIPIAAVALGAKVIEKHVTLDVDGEGPDARTSLDFFQFADMVDAIRNVEQALECKEKHVAKCEEPLLWRKVR